MKLSCNLKEFLKIVKEGKLNEYLNDNIDDIEVSYYEDTSFNSILNILEKITANECYKDTKYIFNFLKGNKFVVSRKTYGSLEQLTIYYNCIELL